MKNLLLDYSNYGILYVSNSFPVLNHLKKGLLDSEHRILHASNSAYSKVSREMFFDDSQHFVIDKWGDAKPMSNDGINDFYLERRRLAKLRGPVMERLMNMAWSWGAKTRITPWDTFESEILHSFENSDPDTETWSESLTEYAFINHISPSAAYKELKLEYECIHSVKMRIYSTIVYFANKINKMDHTDQVQPMIDEIANRFIRDNWI